MSLAHRLRGEEECLALSLACAIDAIATISAITLSVNHVNARDLGLVGVVNEWESVRYGGVFSRSVDLVDHPCGFPRLRLKRGKLETLGRRLVLKMMMGRSQRKVTEEDEKLKTLMNEAEKRFLNKYEFISEIL